jgi:hypothetical protein
MKLHLDHSDEARHRNLHDGSVGLVLGFRLRCRSCGEYRLCHSRSDGKVRPDQVERKRRSYV